MGEELDIVAADPTRGLPSYDQGSRAIAYSAKRRYVRHGLGSNALPPAMADAFRVQLLDWRAH